jgi:hypothetical protein
MGAKSPLIDLQVLIDPEFSRKTTDAWLQAKFPNQDRIFIEYGLNVRIKDDLELMDRYYIYAQDSDYENDEVKESSRILELPNLRYDKYLSDWLRTKKDTLVSEIETKVLELRLDLQDVTPYLNAVHETLVYLHSKILQVETINQFDFISTELIELIEYVNFQKIKSRRRKSKACFISLNSDSDIGREDYKSKIDDLFNKLSNTGFIGSDTSVKKKLHQLFQGEKLSRKINWLKDRQDLKFFIIQLRSCSTVKFETKKGIWLLVAESFLVKNQEIDPVKIRKDHLPLQDTQDVLKLAIEKLANTRRS